MRHFTRGAAFAPGSLIFWSERDSEVRLELWGLATMPSRE